MNRNHHRDNIQQLNLSPNVWNVVKFILIEITVSGAIVHFYNQWFVRVLERGVRRGGGYEMNGGWASRLGPVHNSFGGRMGKCVPIAVSLVIYELVLLTEYSSDTVIRSAPTGKLVRAITPTDIHGNIVPQIPDLVQVSVKYKKAAEMYEKCARPSGNGTITVLPMAISRRCIQDNATGASPAGVFEDICAGIGSKEWVGSGVICGEDWPELLGNLKIQFTVTIVGFRDVNGRQIARLSDLDAGQSVEMRNKKDRIFCKARRKSYYSAGFIRVSVATCIYEHKKFFLIAPRTFSGPNKFPNMRKIGHRVKVEVPQNQIRSSLPFTTKNVRRL